MAIVKGQTGKRLQMVTRAKPTTKIFTAPKMPPELPREMHKEWTAICKNLNDESLWHPDRVPLVAGYLYSIHLHRQAAQVLEDFGAFDAETGKPHQAQGAAQRAMVMALSCAKTLGLSVTASHIAAKAAVDEDKSQPGGGWAKAAGKAK